MMMNMMMIIDNDDDDDDDAADADADAAADDDADVDAAAAAADDDDDNDDDDTKLAKNFPVNYMINTRYSKMNNVSVIGVEAAQLKGRQHAYPIGSLEIRLWLTAINFSFN